MAAIALSTAPADHALAADGDRADLVVGFHAVDDVLEALRRPAGFLADGRLVDAAAALDEQSEHLVLVGEVAFVDAVLDFFGVA